MEPFDKTWHLAQAEVGNVAVEMTEFELQLWRVFYGFLRWQEECEKSINGTDLTGNELAVLHVIRMKEKPKTIYDIARLLNRHDTFNIQYSIRKLLKMGFIEKAKSVQVGKKNFSYQVTSKGIKNTDSYTQARNNVLLDMVNQEKDLNLIAMTKMMAKLKAIYDEADRTVASYANQKK